MAGKNKIAQWAEIASYPNFVNVSNEGLLEADAEIKGKWHKDFFKNDNPITLELGCGKGEYTVGLARKFPNRNFIGVDVKSHRMCIGARASNKEGLQNVGFIRTRIDFIDKFFDKDEVEQIWLTFSDPQKGKPKKRLTSKLFIDRYRTFLKKDGVINMKTDSHLLFESTLEQVEEHNYELLEHTWELYENYIQTMDEDWQEIMSFKTYYEKKWLQEGKKIKFCRFKI